MPDYPTPQAHSPHLIVSTVKAVAEGVTTTEALAERLKLSERSCAYYTNAAGTLGYLRHGRVAQANRFQQAYRGVN